MKKNLQMRQEVEDVITGYKGHVTGKLELASGVIRYLVESLADGKINEQMLDAQRLRRTGNRVATPADDATPPPDEMVATEPTATPGPAATDPEEPKA